MAEKEEQVVVGYYTAPDGQVIPLMADAKFYPNGVPANPLLTPAQSIQPNVLPVQPGMPVYSNVPPIQPMPSTRSNVPPVQPIYSNMPPVAPSLPVNPNVPPIPQSANSYTQPMYSNVPPMNPGVMPPQTKVQKKQEKSFENIVGMNLMGILASVLIFIGLILFATVAYETFSDAVRVVLLYIMSGLILAVGLIGMHRNRNAFNLSLAGCGVGAVYISLFLTYGYFELINGIALYILLAVWSVIVFFLGGKGSLLFKSIGQGGVLISAVYGTVMLFKEPINSDLLSFTLVLLVYYMLVTVVYLLMDSRKGMKENLPALIMDLIGAMFLTAALFRLRYVTDLWVQVVLTVILLFYLQFLLYMFWQRIEKDNSKAEVSVGWVFFFVVGIIFSAVVIAAPKVGDARWISGCIALVQYGILWFMAELRGHKDICRTILLVILYICLLNYIDLFGLLSDILGVGIFALLFLTAGFFKKDKVYFSFGYAATFQYVLLMEGEYPAVYSLFSILFILLGVFFILYSRDIYHSAYKMLSYIMLQVFLLNIMYDILPQYTIWSRAIWTSILYWISVLLCIAATHSSFSDNWMENGVRVKEKEIQILLGAMNVLFLLWGISAIRMKNGEIFHVITLFVFLACCVHNIVPMLKGYGQKMGAGIYIGVKITFFLVVSLWSYEVESIFITLACLILALAFIIFGFARMYKPIRLYGLILSLYSIFKLVLFDVQYNSTLARALTIMGCGLLAFAISFVYNLISRRLESQQMAVMQAEGAGQTVMAQPVMMRADGEEQTVTAQAPADEGGQPVTMQADREDQTVTAQVPSDEAEQTAMTQTDGTDHEQ